MYISEIVT